MTTTDLLENLERHSPFRFEGFGEKYEFMDGILFIDGSSYGKYSVTSGQSGLNLGVTSLSPFQPNVKIVFGDTSGEVIVNYDERAIRTYPRDTRHPSAVDGFLILKSTNIKK
jgi:hypothetical protein